MFMEVLDEIREKFPKLLNRKLEVKGLTALDYIEEVPDKSSAENQCSIYLDVDEPFSFNATTGEGLMRIVVDCVLSRDIAKSSEVENYLDSAMELFRQRTFGHACGDMVSFIAKMDGGDDFNGFAVFVTITAVMETDGEMY